MISDSIRDLRYACRSIARMPLLAAVVVVSLGAGIGVNTVIFSWIQTRLLKPLAGVAGSAEFHLVESRTDTGMHLGYRGSSTTTCASGCTRFAICSPFACVPLYLGEAGQVERAYGLLVSDNYFSALGLQPEIGRFSVTPTDDPADRHLVRALADPLRRPTPACSARRCASTAAASRSLGVAPREFQGTTVGLNFEVWLPATLAPVLLNGSRELDDRSVRGCSVMGKLQAGATLAQAQSDLDGVMRQLARAYPETNATLSGEVLPFWQFAARSACGC